MRMNCEHSQPDKLYPVLTRYISTVILLSAEEERILAINESAEASDRLILSHLPLVKSVAFNFNNCGIDVKDLFNQGVIGLIKAVDRYKPECGRLAAFARPFILGEIYCYLNKNQRLLHLPEPLRRAVNKFCRVCRQLGEGATDAALAAVMDSTTNEVSFLRECAGYEVESLDAPLETSGDALTLGEIVGSMDPGFDEVEVRVSVAQLLSQLSAQEREVIRCRYGLDDGIEMSLRAVGARFGKSHEWVAKVEKTALLKLRKRAN